MMDGNMTIKRPEVELDPGIVNKSFEFESRRSQSIDFDIPERDYEVTGIGSSTIRVTRSTFQKFFYIIFWHLFG